jgi:23S rRNA pseudouridine1911/1915/1917 synthase
MTAKGLPEAGIADSDVDADFEDAAPAGAPSHDVRVEAAWAGERLDKALAALVPECSRSQLRRWIDEGRVLVNGAPRAASESVARGDRIAVRVPPVPVGDDAAAEPMDLDIVHEDDEILVLDKPAGLVVHPGAGNPGGTLMNGLLAWDPRLAGVARAGIVHRLDAGTTGLMVVARTPRAQVDLARQLLARSILREYWALVLGACVGPVRSGLIEESLERDPRNRLRFRVGGSAQARPARTHWRRLALLGAQAPFVSWIACRLDTGRTHQIRVHLEHLGHPLLGDPVYRRGFPGGAERLPVLSRQALHACRLELRHPASGETMSWFRPPPPDLRDAMLALGVEARRIEIPSP